MRLPLNSCLRVVAAAGILSLLPVAHGQVFSDGLDSLANFTVVAQADSTANIVNYGGFTVGAQNFALAEAPRRVSGSAATSGVLLRSNKGDATPAATAVNLILGATPQTIGLSAFTLSFDMYLSVAIPIPSGGTEQAMWGVGRSGTTPFGRNNRTTAGSGTWGWLSTEGGYATDDYTIMQGTTSAAVVRLGNDAEPALSTLPLGPLAGSPGKKWTQVDIYANSGTVQLYVDGVKFLEASGQTTSGLAFVGYEDAFSGISGAPDFQWGVLDNVVVKEGFAVVPEPSAYGLGLGGLALVAALIRRRSAARA